MLQRIMAIPPCFYQLILFNIGLILALSKEISFLCIVSSLLFIIAAAAPVAVFLGILPSSSN